MAPTPAQRKKRTVSGLAPTMFRSVLVSPIGNTPMLYITLYIVLYNANICKANNYRT